MRNPFIIEDFQQGVETAKSLFRLQLTNEFMLPMSSITPGYYKALNLGVDGLKLIDSEIEPLIEGSQSDEAIFDTLRFGLAMKLHMGEPVPQEAIQWLVQFLIGNLEVPKRKTGRHKAKEIHSEIGTAVMLLSKGGMTPTRNDKSEPTSACDAVAAALKELDLSPTAYKSVKDIWQEFKRKSL